MDDHTFSNLIFLEDRGIRDSFRRDWDAFISSPCRTSAGRKRSLDSSSLTRLIAENGDRERKTTFFSVCDSVRKGKALSPLESSYLPLVLSPLFFPESGLSPNDLRKETESLMKKVRAAKDDARLVRAMVFTEYVRTGTPVPGDFLSCLIREIPEISTLYRCDITMEYMKDGDTGKYISALAETCEKPCSPLISRYLARYLGLFPLGRENGELCLIPRDELLCSYEEKVDTMGISSLIRDRVGHRNGSPSDHGDIGEVSSWSRIYRLLRPSCMALVNVPGTVLGGTSIDVPVFLSGLERFLSDSSRLISDAVFTWRTGAYPHRPSFMDEAERRKLEALSSFMDDIDVKLLLPERTAPSDGMDWVDPPVKVKMPGRNGESGLPLFLFVPDSLSWMNVRDTVPVPSDIPEATERWYEILRKGFPENCIEVRRCLGHVIAGFRTKEDASSLIADLRHLALPCQQRYLEGKLSWEKEHVYEYICSMIHSVSAIWRIPADLGTVPLTRDDAEVYDAVLSMCPDAEWTDDMVKLILSDMPCSASASYSSPSSSDWMLLRKGIEYARRNIDGNSILCAVRSVRAALDHVEGRHTNISGHVWSVGRICRLEDHFRKELMKEVKEIHTEGLERKSEPFGDDDLIPPPDGGVTVETHVDPKIAAAFSKRLSEISGTSRSGSGRRKHVLDWKNGLAGNTMDDLSAYAVWRNEFLSSKYMIPASDRSFKFTLFCELTHAGEDLRDAMMRAMLDLSSYDSDIADATFEFLLSKGIPLPKELADHLSWNGKKLFQRIRLMSEFGAEADFRNLAAFSGISLTSLYQEASEYVFPHVWKLLHGERLSDSLTVKPSVKAEKLAFDFPSASLGSAVISVSVPSYSNTDTLRKHVRFLWNGVCETVYDIASGGCPHPSEGLTEGECFLIRKTVWDMLFLDEEIRNRFFPGKCMPSDHPWPFSLSEGRRERNGLKPLPPGYFLSPLSLRKASHDAGNEIARIAHEGGFMNCELMARSGLSALFGRAELTAENEEVPSPAVAEAYYRNEKYSSRITEKEHDLFCDALLVALMSDPESGFGSDDGRAWQQTRYVSGKIPGTDLEGWYIPFRAKPDDLIAKLADNAVRKLKGNALLKLKDTDSPRYGAVGKALDDWVRAGGRNPLPKGRIDISKNTLDALRRDSEFVREALRTEEDGIEEHESSHEEYTEEECIGLELTELERKILALLLEERSDRAWKLAEEEFTSLDVICDEINDKAGSVNMDFFIDDEFNLYPDIVDTVREILSM